MAGLWSLRSGSLHAGLWAGKRVYERSVNCQQPKKGVKAGPVLNWRAYDDDKHYPT
ncbi:hypothetical protein Lpp46_0042 [Lacticaseibacillus paracasei subsp. paracasei Lpp46]|nr:hypothetical protein Lpp46_0042 [Lacticaseibacillus paracasei subsp. paracasei Lpp46]